MNITIKEIYDFIDSFAPFESQCGWDNSGLLIGEKTRIVHKTAFALDASNDVIEEAVSKNCDLLITHHPVIFSGLKSIDNLTPAYNAIKNNLAVISAHTNYDKSEKGVNNTLANILDLTDAHHLTNGNDSDICVIGNIAECSPEELSIIISKKLHTTVKFANAKNKINKVAVCGGAGGDFLLDAKAEGADAFITGEVKHHEYLLADDIGISLFEAGHFETENPSIKTIHSLISEKFAIECILIDEKNPVNYYGGKNAT